MTWFKVDDSFYDHPKVFDAPDCALALWLRAGAWSARSLTDGFVPAKLPARLCDDPDTAVKELVDRGLWLRAKGGYQFHDWDEYQPRREEVLAAQAKKSSGGKIGNHRRWHVDRGVTDPGCPYCRTDPPSDNRSVDRSDSDQRDRIGTESLANRPSRPVPSRPASDGGTAGEKGEGDQSVRTRARVREALRWLSANYGLTDTEAARAWEVAEARARDRIKNPVRYLQRMAERGHLADIIGAIQTRHNGSQPEPPGLHLIDGPAASLHARRTAIDDCRLCDHNGMTVADPDRPKRCDHGDTAPTQPPLMFTVPGDGPDADAEPCEPPIHGQQRRHTP